MVWTTRIERPAGTGFLTETGYVFPTESGGLQIVCRDDGRVVLVESKREDSPHVELRGRKFSIVLGPLPKLRSVTMRNLVAADDVVLLQSFDRLVAVESTGGDTDGGRDRHPDNSRAATVGDSETVDPRRAAWWALAAQAHQLADRQSAMQIVSLVRPSLGFAASLVHTAQRLTPLMRSSDTRAAELMTRLAEALLEEEPGRESAVPERQAASASLQSTWRRLMKQPVDRLFEQPVGDQIGDRSVFGLRLFAIAVGHIVDLLDSDSVAFEPIHNNRTCSTREIVKEYLFV